MRGYEIRCYVMFITILSPVIVYIQYVYKWFGKGSKFNFSIAVLIKV